MEGGRVQGGCHLRLLCWELEGEMGRVVTGTAAAAGCWQPLEGGWVLTPLRPLPSTPECTAHSVLSPSTPTPFHHPPTSSPCACCRPAHRSMPPSQVPTLQRPVIVAGPAQLGRHTVEEATEAAERLGQLAGADYYGARVVQQQQIQAARDTQMELDAHFVMVRGVRV